MSCLVLLWAGASPALAELYIAGNGGTADTDPQRYDRFYVGADKAFIGAGLDFSGVGSVNGAAGGGPWATMISSQYFLTAYHYAAGGTVTFFPGNTTSGGGYSFSVDPNFRQNLYYNSINGSVSLTQGANTLPADVCIERLTSPIPASDHIASYPVLELPLTNNLAAYVGTTIYNYGSSDVVGRNIISNFQLASVLEGGTGGEDGPDMVYDYLPPGMSGSVGQDETYLQPGDSGGPSFAVVNGQLALLGEHYDISAYGAPASDGSSWSSDGFLPYYVSTIDSVLPANQQISVVVPEPSTLALLLGFAGGAAAWAIRRRRA